MLFSLSNINAQNNAINFIETANNYIIVPNNSAINVTDNFTIEFWIQPGQKEEWAVLFQEGKCNNSSFSYNIHIKEDSSFVFAFNCIGNCNYTNAYQCDTKINSGVCMHIAITYTSTEIKIYYNGFLQPGHISLGSYCGILKNSSEPLRIAHYVYLDETVGAYYTGLLDELKIWNRVLTPAEIYDNYMSLMTGSEEGLKLYYKFSEAIEGSEDTVLNYATTGSVLNGITYSLNEYSPYTSPSCFFYTGVENYGLTENKVSIYPNPSSGDLKITGHDINSIEIRDLVGNIIIKKNFNSMRNINLSLDNFGNGIYFVLIQNGKTTTTERLIIVD